MKAVMTIVKKVFPLILIVGLIGWAFGITYTGLSILETKTITYGTYTWTYYHFNVHDYIKAIEHSLTDAAVMQIIPETPQLTKAPNWSDILSVLKWAFNTFFIYVFNCIIYALNWTLLAPLKIILYPVNVFYALFGLNTAHNDYITGMQMLYSFEIPQIPPI